MRGLSSELEFTKQRLQSVVEEYETSQEEMRAANEELQSANEELRSTLEELETSKEELQSINEELQTANEENRHRVAELSQISSDLQHLMAATHIATLFLDRELRILRFTPQVGELFSLRPIDSGRPLSDLTHRLGYDELIGDATNVLAQLTTIEREVQDHGGRWYLARLRPYLSADDRVDGVVLTFVDITSRKHSEEALRLSKERYRRLFESMDEGFCVIDVRTPTAGGTTEYRVLETNPAFDHQTGLENVLGTSLEQCSPSLLVLCREALERLSATPEPVRFECATTERDNWFDVYAFKLSDVEGVRIVMLLRNVSERKKAEEALRLASERDAFRLTLSDALRVLDESSEINEACCRALAPHLGVNLVFYGEVSEDGTLAILAENGTGIEPLPPSLPLQELFGQSRVEQLRAGRTLSVSDVRSPSPNAPGRTATGQFELHAYVAVPLLRNGRLAAVLLVHQNEPRAWSDAEVSIIEEAADRTWTAAERARAERAVRTSAAALREADSRKDEFLAMLSHELRNPLAPIMNGLYLLEHTPPGSEQASTAQAVMRRQVAQLARLVDDLLDLTRIARGKIQLKGERMDLNRLVQRTVDDYRSLFQKNEVSLAFEPASGAVPVNGDVNRLAQAVGNLLQNCAKFTTRGGHTQVSVHTDDEASTAEIRIVDSGVGMTAEVLSRLFQPFMQGETTIDRSQGGLGLGLALTKRLVELHGGAISAHSEGPGKGTAFFVRLPIERGGAGQTEPPRSTAEWHRRRVLIIEDNVDAADTLKAALEFSSHEVAVAYDGAHGLKKAREFQPEVVLCDLGLPGMDGYQVAQAFRADPLLSGTYMIALSGYAMPEDRQRAHTAGFNRHLAKPPDLEQLEDLLSKVRLPAAKSER